MEIIIRKVRISFCSVKIEWRLSFIQEEHTKRRTLLMTDRFFLYDEIVNTRTRFVSFVGENQRFDLAIIQSDRYYGKQIVLDIQGSRFAIIGPDDLEEEGYLEYAFNLSEEDAEELRSFLLELV